MRQKRLLLNIISVLILITFGFQQFSYATPTNNYIHQNLAIDSKLPEGGPEGGIDRGDTLTIDDLHDAASALGLEDPTDRESAIVLERQAPVEKRVRIASVSLDPRVETLIDENAEAIQGMDEADRKEMVNQMRSVLTARGQDVANLTDPNVIERFFGQAGLIIRPRLMRLARQYDLDPQTVVTLEWGSKRSARFRRRGRWEQEIVLNINLLVDNTILEAEMFHEILHPAVDSWSRYLHLEAPQLFKAAGINIKDGIAKEPQEGYIATTWEWGAQRDETSILAEIVRSTASLDNKEGRELATEVNAFLERTLLSNLEVLHHCNDERCNKTAFIIEADMTRSPEAQPVAQSIDALESRLRDSMDALSASQDPRGRGRYLAAHRNLGNTLIAVVSRMLGAEEGAIVEMAEDLKHDVNAKALIKALGEVFILMKELEFLDARGREGEDIAGIFESSENILDRDRSFANLLKLEGTVRLRAVIEHVSNNDVYANTPELNRGATLLLRALNANFEAFSFALGFLGLRMQSFSTLGLDPADDMDEVISRIEHYDVQYIRVNFVDPQGRLKGQRKSVLMPVNEMTINLLCTGVGFDGSSIVSTSAAVVGKSEQLGSIFASDFNSRILPGSLRIVRGVEANVASIDAEVISHNVPNPPHPIRKEHGIRSKRAVTIDRSLDWGDAVAEVKRILQNLGLKKVHLLMNDWAEDVTVISLDRTQLTDACHSGLPLASDDAAYLPTVGQKKNLKIRPDPYSFTLITYPNREIEPVMVVNIVNEDGTPFEGDFRAKLQYAVRNDAKDMGFASYKAPEPELFFLRRLADGNLVAADTEGYYADLTGIPTDLRHTLMGITIASASAGIPLLFIHHEVSPGQYEIPYMFSLADESADTTVLYMYIVKQMAALNGLIACFMPKPINGINGSGMHVHQSLVATRDIEYGGVQYKKGENVIFDPNGRFQLSKVAEQYIAGLLKYGPAMLRLTNPDPNSYRRLVPHYEAPTNLVYGDRNRSCAVRIPAIYGSGGARFEYRVPDPYGNIYAKFYAMLTAGLAGISEELEPPEPVTDRNVFDMPTAEKVRRGIDELPGGPGGLRLAIQRMNDPAQEAFVTSLVGPPDSGLRRFLSQSRGVFNNGDIPRPSRGSELAQRRTDAASRAGGDSAAGPTIAEIIAGESQEIVYASGKPFSEADLTGGFVVLLAGGAGTRFADRAEERFGREVPNKVLAPLEVVDAQGATREIPFAQQKLTTLSQVGFGRVIAIVGHNREAVIESLQGVDAYITQPRPIGTANAMMQVAKIPELLNSDAVLFLTGGDGCMRPDVAQRVIEEHQKSGNDITVLTLDTLEQPGLGRIVRHPTSGAIDSIVEISVLDYLIEQRQPYRLLDGTELSPVELREIRERNTGSYIVSARALNRVLGSVTGTVTSRHPQGEFLATDMIRNAASVGFAVGSVIVDAEGAPDANTIEEFDQIQAIVRSDPRWRYAERTGESGLPASPTGAFRIKGEEGDSTGVTADEHKAIRRVIELSLDRPEHLMKAYAVATNGQNIGRVKVNREAGTEFASILAGVNQRLGRDANTNFIVIPGFMDVCSINNAPRIGSHEGHGLAGPDGRSAYIDEDIYRRVVWFNTITMEEKIDFFAHLATHLDNPIRPDEDPQAYEDRVEELAPTQSVREKLKEIDAQIAKVHNRGNAMLLAHEDRNTRTLNESLGSDNIRELPTGKIGLIVPASFILENMGTREVLDRLGQSAATFEVIVDAETETQRRVVEMLNLNVSEVVVTAPTVGRKDRIEALTRRLRSRGIIQDNIGCIENPTADVQTAIAELEAMNLGIHIGVPRAAGEGQLLSVRGVFHNVIDAIVDPVQRRGLIFAIQLPVIETPSQDLQRGFEEYKEGIEFLIKA